MDEQLTMSTEAKDFYATLSKTGTEAMLKAKAEGQWTHRAPFGYVNARHERDRAILKEDPKSHHFLVMARELRSKGLSYREIRRRLGEAGLETKGGYWSSVSFVHFILNSSRH